MSVMACVVFFYDGDVDATRELSSIKIRCTYFDLKGWDVWGMLSTLEIYIKCECR